MSDPNERSQVESAVNSGDVNLADVVTAESDAAGVAFGVASVGKFKLGKDGPSHPDTPAAFEAQTAEEKLAESGGASGITSADVASAAGKVTPADAAAAKTDVSKLKG